MTATTIKETVSARATAWTTAFLVALLVVFTAIALFHSAVGAFFRVPQNFNEGWNAYLARGAYEGKLYFPYDALVANNYPPLSYYLIGAIAKIGGDPLYIGRFLSAAGLFAVGVNIYAILRFFRVDRLMAASIGIGFLGYIAMGYSDYVATNDPQWLGHGVMTTGLALFFWRYPGRGTVVASAVLMMAAGLIKHILVPIPLAVTVWLFLYDRSRLWLWLSVCVAVIAAAAAVMWALYGPLAFQSILRAPRQYMLLQTANAVWEYVAPALPLVALSLVTGVLNDKHARLLFLYALFAVLFDLYAMSAVGVAYNGILDFYIAVALLAGWSIGRLVGVARLFGLAAVTLPLVLVAAHLTKPHRVWQEFQEYQTAFKEDEALVRAAPGPALCYASALCYWAGKPFDFDFYNGVNKMDLDPVFRRRFIEKLDHKYFAIIEVKRLAHLPPNLIEHMPDDVIAAIHRNYVLFKVSKIGWKYYRPRP